MIVKVKKDRGMDGKWVWIYVCKEHGSKSDDALRCPCLEGYPSCERER